MHLSCNQCESIWKSVTLNIEASLIKRIEGEWWNQHLAERLKGQAVRGDGRGAQRVGPKSDHWNVAGHSALSFSMTASPSARSARILIPVALEEQSIKHCSNIAKPTLPCQPLPNLMACWGILGTAEAILGHRAAKRLFARKATWGLKKFFLPRDSCFRSESWQWLCLTFLHTQIYYKELKTWEDIKINHHNPFVLQVLTNVRPRRIDVIKTWHHFWESHWATMRDLECWCNA